MVDRTLPLPGLSPVEGKEIVARFDGGQLSSDGGLLVLREIEQRLKVADRLAVCIDDPRDPGSTVHTVADIIRFRLLMISADYEDGNDATGLRTDPLFKLALERLASDRDLCSQSTISRLENLPDARTLIRLARALVELYCASFRQVPRRIMLEHRRHLRCGARRPAAAAVQRPLRRIRLPADRCFRPGWSLRHRAVAPGEAAEGNGDPRLSAPPGAGHPQPLAAGRDSPARRQPLRLPRSHGLVQRSRLRLRPRSDQHAEAPCHRPRGKHRRSFQGHAGRGQGFKEFYDTAGSWSRVRRIVARVEASSYGADSRFIVTNLGHGSGRSLYQDLYCRRGQAENHIKAWKTHLAADRTSCPKATANQFRLFLHAGAYWLLWSLRTLMPKRSSWRVAQFDTLRLRLIKVAARIVETKTKIKIHLPTGTPDQAIWHLALGRLPRMII